MMLGWPPSPHPRGQRIVCSRRVISLALRHVEREKLSAAELQTHPLEASLYLALVEAMVVKVDESHRAQGFVYRRGCVLTIGDRAMVVGAEINRGDN